MGKKRVLGESPWFSLWERQEGMRGKEILGVYLSNFAGKIQENRRGFLGRFKEVRREIEIPPGSFSFCHFFFWRSKRKSETAPANLQEMISLAATSKFLFPSFILYPTSFHVIIGTQTTIGWKNASNTCIFHPVVVG